MSAYRHLKVYWHHALDDEPSLFFYEISDGWVVRVIEVYSSGEIRWANGPDALGGATFPDQPVGNGPDPEHREFHSLKISSEQFQRHWTRATNKG